MAEIERYISRRVMIAGAANKIHGRVAGTRCGCKPTGDYLRFLGLLDKTDANCPTALALQYPRGGTNPERKVQADGLMYVTNSKSNRISAPVFARYIPGSGEWDTEAYNAHKPGLLAWRGSYAPEAITEIFPLEESERLLKETAKGTVFEAK